MPKGGTYLKNPKSKIIVFLVWILTFGFGISFASGKKYDGIWFLGLNMHKDLFQDVQVRQAVAHCIDIPFVATKIISEEVVPASVIPPSMLGYDPDLAAYKTNPTFSKLLMKRAGYSIKDKRLKNLTLLHTDGIKTVEIVNKIKKDLEQIGMSIQLKEISYRDQEKWAQELASETNDFFVMGYKAGVEQLFTEEAVSDDLIDSYALVEPIFNSQGEANFTGYKNKDVDESLQKISGLDPALKGERHNRLKKVNVQVYKDLPVIVLFYIERL